MRTQRKSWKRKQERDNRRADRPSKPRFRPWLEALEERIEPSAVWNSFPVPKPSVATGSTLTSGGVTGIAAGPDGAIWYTANWQINNSAQSVEVVGRMALDGTFTQYQV